MVGSCVTVLSELHGVAKLQFEGATAVQRGV